MQTTDIGNFFFATVKFVSSDENLPLIGALPSQETEPPFRRARAYFLRLPLTPFGVTVGRWRPSSLDPDSALRSIMAANEIDLDAEIGDDDKRTMREIISNQASDWDDEWTLVNMLGVAE